MVRIDWSLPALDDLREVFRYVARDSRKYARARVERITGPQPQASHSGRRWARFCPSSPFIDSLLSEITA